MSMVMIKVPRQKTEELKGMIEQGLHMLGKAMNIAESMCEDDMMGERYGHRMGMRDEEYYPPQYPMNERWEAYGDRQGMRGTGRYSMYR